MTYKSFHLTIRLLLFSTILFVFSSYSIAQDQNEYTSIEDGIYVVLNSEQVSSILAAGGEEIRITGHMSLYLSGSQSLIREGALQVNGLSISYSGVPQQALAGEQETELVTGGLGFAASPEPQQLEYNVEQGIIQGEIRGVVDASYMSSLIVNESTEYNEGEDTYFETATQPATLRLEIRLKTPLLETLEAPEEVITEQVEMTYEIETEGVKYKDFELTNFAIVVQEELTGVLNVVEWRIFEVVRRLCIQPVRIGLVRLISNSPYGPFSFVFISTGDGLAFGQPGANTEWRKADVVFHYRNWKTIWNSSYFELNANTSEPTELRQEVQDADCIEVFFVDTFDPEGKWGGGATWGLGVSTSQIITTDENADGGIDLTHLAHELGHVMYLCHPQDPTCNGGVSSTGTLMCPSGYLNDNPMVNSQENQNNLANSLFTFSIQVRSTGPDCTDSNDCGPCP